MSDIGPRLDLEEGYDRIRTPTMDVQPCALVLPDGTIAQVLITSADGWFPSPGSFEPDKVTLHCDVRAIYAPGDRRPDIIRPTQELT